MTTTQAPAQTTRLSHQPRGGRPPIQPVNPAPARFGFAGLSAGGRECVKTTATLRTGPLLTRKRIDGVGIVSDQSLSHGMTKGLAGVGIAALVAIAVAAALGSYYAARSKRNAQKKAPALGRGCG